VSIPSEVWRLAGMRRRFAPGPQLRCTRQHRRRQAAGTPLRCGAQPGSALALLSARA